MRLEWNQSGESKVRRAEGGGGSCWAHESLVYYQATAVELLTKGTVSVPLIVTALTLRRIGEDDLCSSWVRGTARVSATLQVVWRLRYHRALAADHAHFIELV